MNFRRFMTLDKENTDAIEEASLSGEELAKELGITRAGAKLATAKAMTHFYDAWKKRYPDQSPFEVFYSIVYGFGLGDDERGRKDVVRNLSSSQKKEIAADLKQKFPTLDASKFGL